MPPVVPSAPAKSTLPTTSLNVPGIRTLPGVPIKQVTGKVKPLHTHPVPINPNANRAPHVSHIPTTDLAKTGAPSLQGTPQQLTGVVLSAPFTYRHHTYQVNSRHAVNAEILAAMTTAGVVKSQYRV